MNSGPDPSAPKANSYSEDTPFSADENNNHSKCRNKRDGPTPPGPEGLPLLGSAIKQARDPFGFITHCAREYGDVVRIDYPHRSFYQLSHPDHVEHVLVDNSDNYVKGEFFNEVLAPVTGRGLLGSEGENWRRQRNLVQPAFQPGQVATHADLMADFATRLAEQWEDGEIRDIKADMSRLTLDIVAAALFNIDIRDEAPEIGYALATVMAHSEQQSGKLLSLPLWVPTKSNRRYKDALSKLERIVYSIIEQRRRDYSDREDVLSMMLAAAADQDKQVTDRELRDQVMTLLIAGHETTALVLTYTWYLLARNPRVEEKVYDEIGKLDERAPTIQNVASLDFTNQVIKEAMRLYPPAHSVLREAVNDDTIGGYRIPSGATIRMSQWIIHRDPRFYTDAKAFRPERWAEENSADRHRFAYFPYGGGSRRCIGDQFAMLESKLVIATLAQRFRLELVSEPDLDLAYTITTRPKNEINMKIHGR